MSDSYRLSGVDVFAAGTRRGKTYTTADLDQIVSNFDRYSTGDKPLLRVPAVIGHTESQEFLSRSDLPAAGWPVKVWRTGNTLKADIEGVHPSVARLIEGKRYRTVSAEIYPVAPEGIPADGRMLRRIAFLGGEIPEVKGLDEIPVPEHYAEAPAGDSYLRLSDVRERDGYVECFAEVVSMDRAGMIAQLGEYGFDRGLLVDSAPDVLLSEMLRVASSLADEARAAADEIDDQDDDEDDEDEFTDDGDEEDEDDTKPTKGAKGKPMKYSEVEGMVARAVESALTKQASTQLAEMQRLAADQLASQKKLTVDAFCESMVKEGLLTPAQVDRSSPASVWARLMRADSKATVAKFSEGGKDVELTELDLQMREIRAGKPVVKFGEKLKADGDKGKSKADEAEDAECEKIGQHFETYAEQYGKYGYDREKLVNGYKAERQRNPKLLARDYLAN